MKYLLIFLFLFSCGKGPRMRLSYQTNYHMCIMECVDNNYNELYCRQFYQSISCCEAKQDSSNIFTTHSKKYGQCKYIFEEWLLGKGNY